MRKLIRTRWTRANDGRGAALATPDGPLSVAAGNRVVEEWMAEYPDPVRFMRAVHPTDVDRAEAFGCSREDIRQACLYGAVRAARKFDPAKGFRFQTYALPWIRQAVQRLCYRDQVDRNNRRGVSLGHLDTPLGGDGGGAVGDLVADRRAESGWREVDAEDSRRAVVAALRRRVPDARRRLVAVLRWGLAGGEKLTLQEVADLIGVTRERVRQIEIQVMEKCEEYLRAVAG
jgi:RNA polymerase sigma factor (sigma-70 family)